MPDKWTVIDQLGAELGHKPNARRMWLARGRVAGDAALEILDLAMRRKIKLRPADMRFEPRKRAEDAA